MYNISAVLKNPLTQAGKSLLFYVNGPYSSHVFNCRSDMARTTGYLLSASFFACCLNGVMSQVNIASLRVVDLTHTFSENTIYWPGNPNFNFTVLARGQYPQYWYEANFFGTAEHGGTHLDAPAHFYKGSYRNQQVPMENLIGPGVIINVKNKTAANPDYRVQIQDLMDWEKKHGRIPNGAIVIMYSGWADKYGNKSQYFGTNETENPATFHFPGFHEDAAYWLVTYRQIHVLGVDTASMDYGQSKTFPVHVTLARENICGVENVANLDKISEVTDTMIYVAAIKLFDGSGGPARVFATYIDKHGDTSSGNRAFTKLLYLLVLFWPSKAIFL